MKAIFKNKKGYIAVMGAFISLVVASLSILYVFNTSKKQEASIGKIKDSSIGEFLNERLAKERIAGLYNKNLIFDIDDDFIKSNSDLLTRVDGKNVLNLSLNDGVSKRFVLEDISGTYGVKPRDINISTNELDDLYFNFSGRSDLRITTDLSQRFSRLTDDLSRDGVEYGSHSVELKKEGLIVDDKDKEASDDRTGHVLLFKKEDLGPGNYQLHINMARQIDDVSYFYSVNQNNYAVDVSMDFKLINRLVKITEIDEENDLLGNSMYLKLEETIDEEKFLSNKRAHREESFNKQVYLLDEGDLSQLNRS